MGKRKARQCRTDRSYPNNRSVTRVVRRAVVFVAAVVVAEVIRLVIDRLVN